jgi:purine-nucleoside phosphorylase
MTTSPISDQLTQALSHVQTVHNQAPLVGVVLGSGLGAFGDSLDDLVKIPYRDIPQMPSPKVAGHAGNLCLGTIGGQAVACLQGRVHLYEGHPMASITFGVRLLARLGCKAVLLTNAAGGLNPAMVAGDFMLLSDHINFSGQNPLVGPNDPTLGERFPDMSEAYTLSIRSLAKQAAQSLNVELKEGVYVSVLGPSYETPAEVRMFARLGADAVGMSTVHEVIALRHMQVKVGAISCITNLAAGISPHALSHQEVEETATRRRGDFVNLLSAWVQLVARELA